MIRPPSMRALRGLSLALLVAAASACATTGAPDRRGLDDAIRGRVASGIRVEGSAAMPPDVSVMDGVTSQEAVSIALWNSPSFQATLSDLGIARADLAEAGPAAQPDPVVPVSGRLQAARMDVAVTVRCDLAAPAAGGGRPVQRAGRRRAPCMGCPVAGRTDAYRRTPMRSSPIAGCNSPSRTPSSCSAWPTSSEARLRNGDISDLEARPARSDAARVQVSRRAAEADRDLARLSLAAVLGLDLTAEQIAPIAAAIDPSACGAADTRLADALASRPDVRAAEIGIEAAAQRARWERSRVVTLIGILDANGRGPASAELGPGVNAEIPIFSRNQGGIRRADVEVERASRHYAAVRAQVATDVRVGGRPRATGRAGDRCVARRDCALSRRRAEAGGRRLQRRRDSPVHHARRESPPGRGPLTPARRGGRPAAGDDRAGAGHRAILRGGADTMHHFVPFAVLALAVSACSRPAHESAAHPPAASVANPQTEAALATVKLTPEAVKRLGIETVAASLASAPNTRSLGGEIVVPEGRGAVVTAPVAGTLTGGPAPQPGARVRRGERLLAITPLNAADRDQRVEAQRAERRGGSRGVGGSTAGRAAGATAEGRGGECPQRRRGARAAQRDRGCVDRGEGALVRRCRETPSDAQGELVVSAPLDGIVQKVSAVPGQTVSASAPLLELAQVDALWVRVPVYAGDARSVDQQQPATVRRLGDTQTTVAATRVMAPLRGDPDRGVRGPATTPSPGAVPVPSGPANACSSTSHSRRASRGWSFRTRRSSTTSTARPGSTRTSAATPTCAVASTSPATPATASSSVAASGRGHQGRHRRRGRAVRHRVRSGALRCAGSSPSRCATAFVVVALGVLLIVAAARTLRTTPLDVFPEFAPPLVEVQTEAPGLSTNDVEALVTVPLEAALNGIPGLDRDPVEVGARPVVGGRSCSSRQRGRDDGAPDGPGAAVARRGRNCRRSPGRR